MVKPTVQVTVLVTKKLLQTQKTQGKQKPKDKNGNKTKRKIVAI